MTNGRELRKPGFKKGNKHWQKPGAVNTRFKEGHDKNRIPCIYDLALRKAELEGYDLHEAIWRVVKVLLLQAEHGDLQSAKLILERLTRPVPTELKVEQDGHIQIVIDTGVPKRADARVISIEEPSIEIPRVEETRDIFK
jgi:hypothetical protein